MLVVYKFGSFSKWIIPDVLQNLNFGSDDHGSSCREEEDKNGQT